MEVTEQQRRLLALSAVRVSDRSNDWSLLAREPMRPDGLEELEAGQITEHSDAAKEALQILRSVERGGVAGARLTRRSSEHVKSGLDS